MAFLTGGANTLDSSYNIDNSGRFCGDRALTREFGADPDGDRKTFTISFWAKRSTLSSAQAAISAATTNNFYDQIIFASNDGFEVNNVSSASDAIQYQTNAKLRDVSAWYHIVVAMDTTQASASNGIKIYINGVLQTSFATSTYNQNATFEIGRNGTTTSIGRGQRDSDKHFDGYLSEVYFIAGAQKAASDFGETNDNGVWIPKEYTGTYGTNGFKLEFKETGTSQNSSGIGADTSGNDQHFAVTNLAAGDVTTDTPTNNFATLNPLGGTTGTGGGTFSEGNCKYVTSGTDSTGALSTIPVGGNLATGKWYCEFKAISKTGNYYNYGVSNVVTGIFSGGGNIHSIIYRSDGVIYINGNSNESSLTSLSDNDIVGMAYNGDLGKLQFYINGSTVGGLKSIPNTGFEVFFCSASNGGSTQTTEINFGNPPFSISSGNADANGYGNFEYSVPSGYYALCTKNLAEYG